MSTGCCGGCWGCCGCGWASSELLARSSTDLLLSTRSYTYIYMREDLVIDNNRNIKEQIASFFC
jgi:hypothetical protein